MRAIVPGKGWAAYVGGTGMSYHYAVLGPLAEGDYLTRVTVTASASAAAILEISLSLGPTGEASAEALQNGMPLFARSTLAFGGVPAADMRLQASGNMFMWVPVGVRGEVGARYVIAGVYMLNGDVQYEVLLGASVLRFTRIPGEVDGR